jgi:hypothetical protein
MIDAVPAATELDTEETNLDEWVFAQWTHDPRH